MKISVDYINEVQSQEQLKISSAKYLADYVIRLKFNNGAEKLVDFKAFLCKSTHPSIKKYLNEKEFSAFDIVDGNLNWNDHDLIFPIWDLYNEKIYG
ncbi:DUF2442 domain-containing protein [Litoribacter ruber]|uniref:DUF2442 domain-containing protein n=1 Tax=Litoribacter ruber TaxID=702568 RepID=UPI001BD9DF55|nr:DUF2442 domain-containing protein [Litoribacter ruber]MBT0812821.1 DUF2442 domain-containing protein [Litoribacter ruber]